MRILLILMLAAVAYGEVMEEIKRCIDVPADKCDVTEVRITPCRSRKQCLVKKGNDASIEFDYVPHFSATSLETKVVYQTTNWDAIEKDACKSTTCPAEAGKAATYSTTMHIGKKLPTGRFEFNWLVYDPSNPENQCCIMLKIKLS